MVPRMMSARLVLSGAKLIMLAKLVSVHATSEFILAAIASRRSMLKPAILPVFSSLNSNGGYDGSAKALSVRFAGCAWARVAVMPKIAPATHIDTRAKRLDTMMTPWDRPECLGV